MITHERQDTSKEHALHRAESKHRSLWFLLIVLSIAPIFPLSNYTGHPHWELIRWIPFQDFSLSRNMLKDIIGNILWFVMFGYLLRYQFNGEAGSPWTIATIAIVAGSVSLAIEFFQVFCHNRIPSMTDVMCNVLGASIGAYFAEKQRATTATELAHYAIIKGDGAKTLP